MFYLVGSLSVSKGLLCPLLCPTSTCLVNFCCTSGCSNWGQVTVSQFSKIVIFVLVWKQPADCHMTLKSAVINALYWSCDVKNTLFYCDLQYNKKYWHHWCLFQQQYVLTWIWTINHNVMLSQFCQFTCIDNVFNIFLHTYDALLLYTCVCIYTCMFSKQSPFIYNQ